MSTGEERQDRIYAFIANKGEATWEQVFEHCKAMEITENPNTLNYDLSRLRFAGSIYLGNDGKWRL